jgi:thiol:disulfide interchange protein DsbD
MLKLLVPALSVLFGAPAPQAPQLPQTKVTLIAEQSALTPGAENTIGLRFELEPGWHIYWQNPGDSGAPPTVEWQMPAGYTAGGLAFPPPERIPAGSLINYGYENSALFLVPIRVPKDASAGADIIANVRYLICREICVPARAKPSIALAVGHASPIAQHKELFAATRARLPRPAPASWSAQARVGKDTITVALTTGARETAFEVFPVRPGIVNDSVAPVYQPTATGATITLKRSEQLEKTPADIPLLIKRADGQAFTLSARVK